MDLNEKIHSIMQRTSKAPTFEVQVPANDQTQKNLIVIYGKDARNIFRAANGIGVANGD